MYFSRFIILLILFILGYLIGIPAEDTATGQAGGSARYLELADSANFYISRENWPKAEEKLIEALRLEPANFSNSLLLANLGVVQTAKGEYEKALESLSLGLNIAPKSAILLNNRAHTYLLTENVEAAKKDLDKSLQIDSLQEWTLKTRAFIYIQDQDKENAKEVLNKLKKEFPNNPGIGSGFAAIAEMEGNLPEAIKNYREALKADAYDDDSREALILLLIKSNDYTAARKEIREGLDLNSENPMYYILRGYLHRLNFRLDEAQADKKIAISKGLPSSLASSFIP